MPGSALEAWIGAIYLDGGYVKAKQFVQQKILIPHIELDLVESQNTDYKSQLLQHAQQTGQKVSVRFDAAEYKKGAGFLATIQWGDITETGFGRSKKIAEQRAAQKLLKSIKRYATPLGKALLLYLNNGRIIFKCIGNCIIGSIYYRRLLLQGHQ